MAIQSAETTDSALVGDKIMPNYKMLTCKDIKKNLYQINEHGQIYSNYLGRKLTPKKGKDGYMVFDLRKENGGSSTFRVAALVLLTFVGNPPQNMKDPTVNHIDGNIENNCVCNLEWMERGLNSSIRKNKGVGEQNHEAKLTENQVIKICKLLIDGSLSYKEISKIFGVSKSTINNIARGDNWKYITCKYKKFGSTGR